MAFLPHVANASDERGGATASEVGQVSAKITGTSFLTADAEASAAFYTRYLGVKILRDTVTASPATKAVYGVPEVEELRVILVVPAIWSKEDPNHLGIAFAEVGAQSDRPFPQQPDRRPRLGEPTLGFEVNDIEAVLKRMEADEVPIVVPLAPSATGRSQAITVFDPNGIRIQLYQYSEPR